MNRNIPGCIPPVHVKSLCEEMMIDETVSNERRAELYTAFTQLYLSGMLGNDSWNKWKQSVSQIGKIGGLS